MDEKTIEKYLRDQVKAVGGEAYKFVSPGRIGMPDRLVIFPGGRVVFAELKAPGKKPRPNQVVQIEKLRRLGADVEVIDSKERCLEFIKNHV